MREGIGEENHPRHESVGAFFKSMTEIAKSLYKNRYGWRRMDARLREAVFLAVSIKNRCKFCFTVHSRLAQKAGMSKAEILALVREDKSLFDERTNSAIEFALLMSNPAGTTTDKAVATLKHHFDATEISAIESAVKFINFANRFFNIFFSPLDLEKLEVPSKSEI